MKALSQPWAKRLISCLFGGLVLALMVGNQEGTIDGDFGVAFFQALGLRKGHSQAFQFPWRTFIFLGLGVVLFLLITFWRLAVPYFTRPGVNPMAAGLLVVLVSQFVMNWYDPIANLHKNGRFATLKGIVDKSRGLSATTGPWFDWLAWSLLLAIVVVIGTAVVTGSRPLGYLAAVGGLAGAVLAYLAHRDVVTVLGGPDHALGVYAEVIGFLLLAAAGLSVALARSDVAHTKAFLTALLDYRPGLPLVAAGIVFGLFAYANDCWFAPQQINADLSASSKAFRGTGLSSLGSDYLSGLGWTTFAVAAVLALVATVLGSRLAAWATAVVSVVGVVMTFLTLKSMTDIGFKAVPNDGGRWNNLGAGGYTACLVFALIGASTIQVLTAPRKSVERGSKPWTKGLPISDMVTNVRGSSRSKAFVLVLLAVAIFYPPMLPVTWQNVLVTQIGVYILLAVGLNVVVGWAGLLDLGYIAFYGIGSYTTAYFIGALPKKPPSWLHVTPLLTFPFAIIACLIAGLLLGAPTLRLRGDYLAIVTLGFGEIISVVATNNPFGITGGPRGPTVPHPVLHLGGLHITWGEDNLPYWYLLLVLLIIVVILFYRLEGSRLGRAWAAIREDEVAAQASGVNTTKAKLLAFAIGASTSGLAGVFFATQVGYFDPTLFGIQASILIVAYVVFGGMGSLPGAMAGAAVLTWLPQFLKNQVPANDRQMWIGAAVLAMMIFRPAGLLPAKRRKAELEGLETASSAEVVAVAAGEGL